tara:strand:- start:86 stop:2452 length:2367 start_codon:yes stop_codon:yes gene_type:complete
MELAQRKLSQKEWESLEAPILGEELRILKMIKQGFLNPNINYNDTQTIINFIKLDPSKKEQYDLYLYENYLKKKLEQIAKLANKDLLTHNFKKVPKLKKADIIRIENMESKLDMVKNKIFEFILIELLNKMFVSKMLSNKYYYTIMKLFKFNISNINSILELNIKHLLKDFTEKVSKKQFIENASSYIEKNKEIAQYKDIKLYNHQKKLFSSCKDPGAKLLFYQAPTGTGKTLSPVGLSNKFRIIFVCAAKHVGLQLAKACISLDIKIAVAFGCKDTTNIRLHWNAAKDTIRNRKTGGIFKVDNSIGDNVEIMISDVQSYIPAMHYMMAFNSVNKMILYWDEPTITLDYEDHPYHEILSRNWRENEIPNIVLSSATLPKSDELENMIESFVEKFDSTNITTITSYDCTKTIPIINSNGEVILPHLLFDNHEDIRKCLKHIKNCKTLLRHFDINEICKFMIYVDDNIELNNRYKIDTYFEEIENIDIISIKMFYLHLLNAVKDDYDKIYNYFQKERTQLLKTSIMVTTTDASTLTDGPTIYLAEDVDKIGMFCLKTAKIPKVMINAIMKDIKTNEKIRLEIDKIMKDINKNKDNEKENEKIKKNEERPESKIEQQMERCDFLRNQIRRIQMGTQFIPNSKEHLEFYEKSHIKNAFTSDIDDDIVEKIMLLEVAPHWKILLLMGIGVFSLNSVDDYVAIMKELAVKQKLYLIIASTDYIYGTNYQFCHGYIGKDLLNMTQEKIIQAFGRVGRSDNKKSYSIRIRNDEIIEKIFTKSDYKLEIENMNTLFC